MSDQEEIVDRVEDRQDNEEARDEQGVSDVEDSAEVQQELAELNDSAEEPGIIDESVYKMGSHRRRSEASGAADASSSSKPVKEKTRPPKSRARTLEDGTILSDDEDDATPRRADDDDDLDLDPAARARREIERRIDEAVKPTKKRRKMDGDDLEQMQDERIAQLREQMRVAAIADAECIKQGVAATNKLELLPEVRDILQKQNLADSVLDNNLLEAVRMWLEPLPDASLPAYEIQKELFVAIDSLPIKTIHLRESGLGKVVLFYQKSKRPQLHIRRTADKLIGRWTRPIMGRSDNYRDKSVVTQRYIAQDTAVAAAIAAAAASHAPDPSTMDPAEAAARRRNRAAIPTTRPITYDIAPQASVDAIAAASQRRGPTGDDQFRRMKMKILAKARAGKSKKSGVSIEGKELH